MQTVFIRDNLYEIINLSSAEYAQRVARVISPFTLKCLKPRDKSNIINFASEYLLSQYSLKIDWAELQVLVI